MDKIIVLVFVVAKSKGQRGRRAKLFADDILPLLSEGKSIAETAKELGKTRQAIYNCLRREDISVELT